MRKCKKCKESKDISGFYTSKYLKNKAHPVCKLCAGLSSKQFFNKLKAVKKKQLIYQTKRRERNLNYAKEYLKSHPCVDCGETNIIILEFDHVRGNKIMTISQYSHQSYSLEKIQAEIDKCEIRCVNCHRMKTAKDYAYFRYIKECNE
jgi:hypothetical protein